MIYGKEKGAIADMEYILQTNQVSKTIGGKSLVIRRSASNTDGHAAPPGGAYRLFCSSYGQNWRTCTMSQLLPHETIVKASEGDPEAVAAVLSHCRIYPHLFQNRRSYQCGNAGAYHSKADRKPVQVSL